MKNALDTTFDHKDPYKILGVTADVAPAALHKAYLQLAKRNHQDLFANDPEKYRSSTRLMQDINAAYELLSDPAKREFWNRRHLGASRNAPQQAARQAAPAQSARYESELAQMVIRKYNQFVDSLRSQEQRQEAIRKIHQFQASRNGSAYIRKLVASLYQDVIDTISRDRRVDRPYSVFDDGLVELTFLYEDKLEVAPSQVFVTYAYILYRENRGKVPSAPGRPKPRRRGPGESRFPMLMLRDDRGSKEPAPAKDVGARIWDWLMAKPPPRRH